MSAPDKPIRGTEVLGYTIVSSCLVGLNDFERIRITDLYIAPYFSAVTGDNATGQSISNNHLYVFTDGLHTYKVADRSEINNVLTTAVPPLGNGPLGGGTHHYHVDWDFYRSPIIMRIIKILPPGLWSGPNIGVNPNEVAPFGFTGPILNSFKPSAATPATFFPDARFRNSSGTVNNAPVIIPANDTTPSVSLTLDATAGFRFPLVTMNYEIYQGLSAKPDSKE